MIKHRISVTLSLGGQEVVYKLMADFPFALTYDMDVVFPGTEELVLTLQRNSKFGITTSIYAEYDSSSLYVDHRLNVSQWSLEAFNDMVRSLEYQPSSCHDRSDLESMRKFLKAQEENNRAKS